MEYKGDVRNLFVIYKCFQCWAVHFIAGGFIRQFIKWPWIICFDFSISNPRLSWSADWYNVELLLRMNRLQIAFLFNWSLYFLIHPWGVSVITYSSIRMNEWVTSKVMNFCNKHILRIYFVLEGWSILTIL